MNTEALKQRLQEKERELVESIARLKAEALESKPEEGEDRLDDAVTGEIEQVTLQEADAQWHTLTQVRDALKRLKDGTYGKCAVCGKPIEPERLEAVPWAIYCKQHEKDLERKNEDVHKPTFPV